VNAAGNPIRLDALIINDDEEAPSLLDPLTGKILFTNRVGKRIIELADGNHSIEEIAMSVAREFRGADETLVMSHAKDFLAFATQKGIVTWMK
jgi:hypothetical protein